MYINGEQLSRRNTRQVLVVRLSEEELYRPNSSSIELVLSSFSLRGIDFLRSWLGITCCSHCLPFFLLPVNQLFGSSWRNCVRSPAFHKLFQFRIADRPWDWFSIVCAEQWELGESSLYGTCPNQNQQLRFQAEIQVNQERGRFKSWDPDPAVYHRRVRCLNRRFSLSLRYPSLIMGSRILNMK